jgi:hypothetical protein
MVPIPKQPVPIPPIDPRTRFGIQPKIDWLTNPATVLRFGDRVVGQVGGLHPSVITAGTRSADLAASVNIAPGDVLTPRGVTAAPGISGLAAGGAAPSGLNVVGGGGLNSALVKNIDALRGLALSWNQSSVGFTRGIRNR